DTLKLIQSLYEKKVTTYPRVDTTFLSDDIYPKVPGILEALQDYTILTSPLKNTKIPKSKKVFDNSKVTDHHAIIPTNVRAGNLTQEEAKIYDLVARRFIAAFYPDCQVANTTVLGQVNSVEFKVTGKQILYSGWRVVFDKEDISNNKEENEERTLPAYVKGESGPHEPALTEKWTQPPKLYTEATLLRAMETAGKLVEDDELRDALKENGIGRPSTRAAIIETLFKRHYIRKERKNLIATSTGIELIQTIHEELLKSAELTGIWENKLRKIERNEYAATDFLTELKQMVSQIVHNVLSDNTYRSIPFQNPETEKIKKEKNTEKIPSTSKSRKKEKTNKQDKISDTANIPCPVCGNGYILKGKSAFGCSEWKNGCTFRINFDGNIENLSQKELLSHLKTYNHNNAEG
ncbi:MAG: DNA topoisomerase, partial [Barnesiella sp.]